MKKCDCWRGAVPCVWPESRSQLGDCVRQGTESGNMPRSLDLFWRQWGSHKRIIFEWRSDTVLLPGGGAIGMFQTGVVDILDKCVVIG